MKKQRKLVWLVAATLIGSLTLGFSTFSYGKMPEGPSYKPGVKHNTSDCTKDFAYPGGELHGYYFEGKLPHDRVRLWDHRDRPIVLYRGSIYLVHSAHGTPMYTLSMQHENYGLTMIACRWEIK